MFARVFFAVCLIALPSVWSYSSGAPPVACVNMTPQHGVPPQKSKAPYKLLLSTEQVSKGGEVELELKGDAADKTIKGFLVQARVGDQPVGQFKVADDDKYAQAIDCGSGKKVIPLFRFFFEKKYFFIDFLVSYIYIFVIFLILLSSEHLFVSIISYLLLCFHCRMFSSIVIKHNLDTQLE